MEQTGLIYMYTAPNGKRYVGQTVRLDKRIIQHKQGARNHNLASYNCALHRAIRKYGYDSFVLDILEEDIPRSELDDREKYWIKEMDSFGENGYNMTEGGDGNLGRTWSEEQRKDMSLKKMGQNKGIPLKEETKRKIGEANKGKSHPISEETRRKISEHNARAVRKKVMFLNDGIYRGKPFYPGMTFESVKDCADYFGVKLNTMSSIKAGKFNKRSNLQIVEVPQ